MNGIKNLFLILVSLSSFAMQASKNMGPNASWLSPESPAKPPARDVNPSDIREAEKFPTPTASTLPVSNVKQEATWVSSLIKPTSTHAKPRITFGGYIKTDVFWDSRQVIALRDGHVLFFPAPVIPDTASIAAPCCPVNDISKTGDFNFLAIQTRLWSKLDGPRMGDFNTAGHLEIDFFGVNDTVINTPRMRYAVAKVESEKFWLWTGFYNHPFLVDECNLTDVISFNAGAPYETFSRNPQVRVVYNPCKNTRFMLTALSEVDFKSFGPLGGVTDPNGLVNQQSTQYIRDSCIPNMNFHFQQFHKEHVFGASVDIKVLKPRLFSSKGYKVDESVTGVSAIAYMNLNFDRLNVKWKFVYAENAGAYLVPSGYGIRTVNPYTDQRTYTPTRSVGGWFEISRNADFNPGLFIGVLKNLGARHDLVCYTEIPGATSFSSIMYGFGTNIDFHARVSPRLMWTFKAFQIGGELEISHARYGVIQQKGKVCVTAPTTNVRPIFATYYNF